MKKIIDIILPNLAIGGAEKVMLLLASQFKANNYEVRFIVRRFTEEGFQKQLRLEYEVINLNAKKVRHFPIKLKNRYKTIDKPNIVIASLWPLTFLTTLILKLQFRQIKVFCVEHGSLKYQTQKKIRLYQLFLKWSLKFTLKFCDKLVCVSEGLKNEIQQLTSYKGHKIIFIPNPIELESRKVELSDIIKDKLKGHVFLSVGRLKKVKNIPLLLKAFKIVSEKTLSTLIILGDGQELEELKVLAQSLKIDGKVHFLGFKSVCKPYYQIANTFVLSSDSEGFGNVIVEALSEGCTVVSTDCFYGPKEILDEGNYGYLAQVNNEKDLGAKMLSSVQYPFPEELLKSRAKRYSPDKIAASYIDLFNTFI